MSEHTLERNIQRVKELLNKPQVEQRTPEWFAQRATVMTASEVSSCLPRNEQVCKPYVDLFNLSDFKYSKRAGCNPYQTCNKYIISKCSEFFEGHAYIDSKYTIHGKKYENIAQRLYRNVYNTSILEFGLLMHDTYDWLGASPDGITPEGTLLEIKCPLSREIHPDYIPLYYWIQVQQQLEVCDLDVCDFLECNISQIDNEYEWNNIVVSGKKDKGIILENSKVSDDTRWVYPPDKLQTQEEYILWYTEFIKNNEGYIPLYYIINDWNIIRIKRDKEWWKIACPIIHETIMKVRQLQSDKKLFDEYIVKNVRKRKSNIKKSAPVCPI